MKEYTLKQEVIYDGKIIRVEKDEVQLEDGSTSVREVVHNSGGVSVLALTKQEEVILVKQFRYPSKEELYEIPGGKQNVGETTIQAGMRELKEETGYVSKVVCDFGYLYPTVAYCSEVIHLVLAKDVSYEAQQLDEGEHVEVVRIPFEKVLDMVMKQEIKDAKTIVAILKYHALYHRK